MIHLEPFKPAKRKHILNDEEIFEKYATTSATLESLAKEYGCSKSTIYTALARQGYRKGVPEGRIRKYKKLDVKEEPVIIHKYTVDQIPTTQLAKDYDVSLSVILRILRRAEVDMGRRPSKMKSELFQKAKALIENGATSREAAKELGVSPSLISKYFHRDNPKKRHREELKGLLASLRAFRASDRCRDTSKTDRQIAALEYFI